ncbi:MAG: capsule biosynthesis protein [Gammaproteobacteria bacterium]|jgi:capsular polysaccharide transport system permease protein
MGTDEAQDDFESLRRARMRRLQRLFRWWVGVPTLIAALYYGLIASDYYQSEARFSIQSVDRSMSNGLDSLLGTLPGAGSNKDAMMVRDYILSRDVLARLDKEHDFINHYQEAGDWFSKLSRNASFEEAFDYYLGRVDVDFDMQSGISTLRVRALNAAEAAGFAGAILKYSEELVNVLSQRAEMDRLELARSEVQLGEERLSAARSAILRQQLVANELNPAESAAAVMEIRTQLESELAKAQAELTEIIGYMRADSPRARALQNRVESLNKQITRENRRLTNPEDDSLSSAIAGFEPLLVEKEFAEQAYASALTSLEIARAEAARQHRYLATIVMPSLPDEPTHPQRLMKIITVALAVMLAFGIGSLLIAAVREHARI